MNLKTFLALSCVLAAAQARPATPASSCSLSCSGRNFWTGYKSGTAFQYAFEQKVEVTSARSEQKSVLMQVTGKANVEVHSDCEMVLTVDVQDTKTSKSPSEATTLDAKSLPKTLADALKEPLRFSFEDGRIASLCPSGAETRASLNFKRGLLSQLHLSIDKPDQEVRVREDDILGSCWTVYAKLGANKLEKTKDLSSCTNSFEVFPRQGVKFEAPETTTKWPTVTQGTLKCTIELDGESMVIKENNCEEERTMEMSLASSPGETVKVTTSLKLQQKTSALASALAEVKERSGLAHKHKTTEKCHDSKSWFDEDVFHTGNECLEKKAPTTGTTSADFNARAKKVIEELCEETKSDMINSTAEKYGELIKYLRGITSQEDFTTLFDWAKGYCGDNSMFKVIVYSALPSVGTQQSVNVILNQLKDSDSMSADKNTASWLANGIAMMPHPTPEIIKDVLEFTKKAKEDSLQIVSKDQPLALSAVTGKYCSLNPNCETNNVVDEVLTLFAESLGTNCSNLESQSPDNQFAADYAFAALLSIGNIGRAKGGASSIIGCAENAKLSLANRAFSLRALRRFPELSTSEKLRLGDLIENKTLDSELRITAYQTVARTVSASFWSSEQALKKLSNLLQNEREDQQLQRYVYSHLSQLLKKRRLSTDSNTVANVLREYERVMMDSRLGGMQVSNYWRKQLRTQYTKSKMELESNLIYSSTSMMPRFVNLNLTVESPLSGETVNMFEVGLRMEGMEGMMEQFFNIMKDKDSKSDELIRKRRQASPELTEEQKQYKQAAKKMRLDVFTRKSGMELVHNNFDDTILGVVPQFMKTLDVANVQGLLQEKLSSVSFDTVGQAAGSGLETTTSFPTIAGFPILLKKEMHYLINTGFKQSFDAPTLFEVKFGLEIQPTVSVHMTRTVLVDSGFERAGLRSQTSALTSVGVKINLEGSAKDEGDIKFSFKLDPLKKQQKVLELKTDLVFIQHSGPSNVIATPVVAPTEMAPLKTKCSTPTSVKLFGRRMCLETNFETPTYSPELFVQQNPGSFRLFIDKDDSYGVYEVTLEIKKDERNWGIMAVVGDQKSPDRHAKFQFSISRSSEQGDYSRKIVLELANPVLPIKWESESKKKGEDYDVTVGLKFGSTDYAFTGAWSREKKIEGWKLSGNFFRKDKERQQLGIVTKFATYGFLKYLPMYRFEFEVATPTSEKLTFNNVLYHDRSSNKFEASLLASYEKSGSVVTSIKSRLQVLKTQREGAGQTRAFIYDTDVVTKAGKNFMHAFSAKIDRKQKESAPDTWVSTVLISHKFKYGVTKENSLFDTDASLQLEETTDDSAYKATGSGTITYEAADSTKKTARLKNLRLVLGESDVIDGNFKANTFLLEYGTENDGSQSQALVAVQVLPLGRWSLYNQCLYLTMKASTNAQTHAFEVRHTSSPDTKVGQGMPVLLQSAKLQYASAVLLDATHKFYPVSVTTTDAVLDHFFNLTTYNGVNYFLNSKYSMNQGNQANTFNIATTYDVNQERKGQLDQTVTIDSNNNRFDYKMECQKPGYTSSFRIYFQNFGYAECRKASAEIVSYVQNQREAFNLLKFARLVREYIGKIQVESGLELNIPSSINLRVANKIDMTITNGLLMNFTRVESYGDLKMTRALQVYKELEAVPGKYRGAYKVDAQVDNVATVYRTEVVLQGDNQLALSLSQTTAPGDQSTDFNVSTVGRFIPRYNRDGQIALELNMTHKYSWVDVRSDFRVVVDTIPGKYLNPALNVSLLVASSSERLSVSYDAGIERLDPSRMPRIGNTKAITSDLKITNTFSAIPFSLYRGITTLSSSRDVPFDFVFKKTLESSDVINFQTTLDSNNLNVAFKSDMLPAKEVSFKVQYKQEADGFISYLSQIKLAVNKLDLTIKDKGKVKFAGRSGRQLFSTVYSGAIEITGLREIVPIPFSMDKLDYSGLLEAKTTGEFDSNFQVLRVEGTSSENLLKLSTKLNYWPFEVSAQINTPLGNTEQYGFNISVVPTESGSRSRAWFASPKKETNLAFWHTYKKTDKIDVTGQLTFKSGHLFDLREYSSETIDSVITVKANSLYDYTFLMNMTTPYSQLQYVQLDMESNDKKQMIAFTLKVNDKQDKVLSAEQNFETATDGRKLGRTTIIVTSIMPQLTGWNKLTYNGNLVTGRDHLYGFEVSLDDAKLAVFDVIWLNTANSYPHLSRLSVQGANFGVDFKVFIGGSQNFQFYALRSGDAAKAQWQIKYKLGETEVQTSLDIVNRQFTSGSGSGFGKSFTFVRKSDGAIEVKADSAGGANSITYSTSMSDNKLLGLKLKFSFGSKESCISYTRQDQQVNLEYGSCTTPNKLQISYQFSDFWTLKKSKVQIGAEHTTVPASNQAFHWLPDVSIPLGLPQFKFNLDINNEQKQSKMTIDLAETPANFFQEFDLSRFPRAMKYTRTLKIGAGPMKSDQTSIINYDYDTRTVDVRLETSGTFKLAISNTEFSVDVVNVFTAGVAYKTEPTTNKKMVEIKGDWRPTAGSQPCVFRLWQSVADGGKRTRYALELVAQTGKDINIVSDVTNVKFTDSEFSMTVTTTMSSTLIENFRTANSVLDVSYLRDSANRNYTINYKESFTYGGVVYYEIQSTMKGSASQFPSTLNFSIPRGYLEAEFSYNFNPEYNPELYLLWSLNKFGPSRDVYVIAYRTKDVVSSRRERISTDFSLEISTPRRLVYLSSRDSRLPNGTVQTELQAYLNKRNLEGFVVTISRDYIEPDVFKRQFRLTLPTRQVGYDRVLKGTGSKLEYNLVFYWDLLTAPDKKVTVDFSRERQRRASGYFYYHQLNLTAPFLKNKISKELLYERKENAFTLSWTHTTESDDKVTLLVNGRQDWNSGRQAFQKEVNVSFTQKKGDVKANVRITVEASKLNNQKMPQLYSSNRLTRVINIYTTVPSLSIDSHVRIRNVPGEEFTYASNQGATFSLRYYTGFKRSRIFLFVSNNKKEAGQLTIVRDWLMSTWQATLDTGTGYMDPKSTLSFPIYEAANVVVKATAGLSANRKKIHFGVISGTMSVKSSINLWNPASVPKDLDFFFVGAKVNNDNTLGYASHWRIRPDTMKSPFTYAKNVLVDPWAKARNLPLGIDTINKLIRPVAQSKSDNIDTDAVLDLLTSISSNDIDSLKRWTAKAKENNEFLSNTIGTYFTYGVSTAKSVIESIVSVRFGNIPTLDLDLLSSISALVDATTRALNSIPVAQIWSMTLNSFRYGSQVVSTYFSAFVDTLDKGIRDKISGLTGGKGSSIVDIVYYAVSSVYPIGMVYEKFTTVVDVAFTSLVTADMELATQLGNVLQPYVINTMAEIPKVYDFFENLYYELNQWGAYLDSLINSAVKDNADKIEKQITGNSAFTKNAATSVVLLLLGDYKGAIRQFFNTDANVVDVWRISCDSACIASGSYAAINGTVYIPFDVFMVVSFDRPDQSDRPIYAPERSLSWSPRGRKSRRQKFTDALQELRSERGLGGVIRRLIAPEQRTAEVAGSYIRTFGGKELRNLSPCRYLLAHDFQSGDFSIYQTYTWDGRSRQRGELLIRFFNTKATISNTNDIKLNGESFAVPSTKKYDEQFVEITGDSEAVSVTFSSELQNALKVKCRRSSDSCTVRIHPLYHGRLNGAFGSNDGNPANDLHGNTDSDHLRLWTTDSCIMS